MTKMFNNETQLILSASSRPGNFGTTLYNHIFKNKNINAVYLSRKVEEVTNLVNAIKTMSCHGCSISMPLKEAVLPLLNELDTFSKKTNSVNTILNKSGYLVGYNTDYYGALKVLEKYTNSICQSNILIYGSGSMAINLYHVLNDNFKCQVYLLARDKKKLSIVHKKHSIPTRPLPRRYSLIINCTPESEKLPKELNSFISDCPLFFQLPVEMSDSPLVSNLKKNAKTIIQGFEMFKYQFQKQFEIYTGIFLTEDEINRFIKDAFPELPVSL